MKCNPRKWLLWAPLAALPLLAAYWLNSNGLERKLFEAAGENLSTIKADWAKLSFDGRDSEVFYLWMYKATASFEIADDFGARLASQKANVLASQLRQVRPFWTIADYY